MASFQLNDSFLNYVLNDEFSCPLSPKDTEGEQYTHQLTTRHASVTEEEICKLNKEMRPRATLY